MVMAYAYRLTGDARYLNAVVREHGLHARSQRAELQLRFRLRHGRHAAPASPLLGGQPVRAIPPVPPGAMAGGPNAIPLIPPRKQPEIASRATAKRYIDDDRVVFHQRSGDQLECAAGVGGGVPDAQSSLN